MRAFHTARYGDPEEVLQLKTVEKPTPRQGEVLIKVGAASVNDYDWCLCSGQPKEYRLFFGLFKPRRKHRCPGMEVAGTVEAAGTGVKSLKVGDRVYGDTSDFGFGSFAEYMTVNEAGLRLMPDSLSFTEAVALPHASALALQALRDEGNIQSGEKVLINGGGGGVGTLAMYLAKTHDAEVTGVDSGEKLERMKTIGFDHVIDYRKENFTKTGQRYDLIVDCRTTRGPLAHLRALKPNGRYVSIGGQSGKLLRMVFLGGLIKMVTKKRLRMLSVKANKDLDLIERLYAEGKLKTEIDGPYPFEQIPQAVKRFGEARHQGKVVVQVSI
jgi:NADPH:quinone reductase-like Zn-dependent oxidoreductase